MNEAVMSACGALGKKAALAGSVASTLAMLCAAPAQAQSAPVTPPANAPAPQAPTPLDDPTKKADSGISDIIVTAQRRGERLQSVPLAITAFSAQSLASAGITDTQSLQTVTPGLIMNKALDSSAPFLRGVGTPDVTPSNEAAVATYLDGFYLISPTSGVFSLSNVERVEVLKGPQGTLFGRNSTGGLIQIITRTPSEVATGNIEVGYANYNTFSGRAYLSGGLGGGFTADLAVSGSDQEDGWGVNRLTGRAINRGHDVTARAKLRWSDGATDVTLALLYAQRRGDIGATYQTARGAAISEGGTTFAGTGKYNTFADQPSRSDVDNVMPTLSVNHDFGAFSLVSLTSFQWVRSRVGIDADGSPLRLADADLRSSSRGWTQELQLVSSPGSRVKWIAGVYGLLRDGAYDPALIGVFPGTVLTNSSQRTTSLSAFGQVTVPLGDRTNLTGGLRYSHDEAKAQSNQSFNGFALGPESQASRTYNKLSYRVSVDHKFGDAILAYASYNRGFKAGLFALINYPIATGETQPEKVDAYEIGVKSDFFNNTVRVNLAAFHYDYSNIQTFFFLNGVPTVLNAPKAKLTGGELEITVRPDSRLTLNAGASFLPDAKYTDFANAPITTPNPAGGNFLTTGQVAGNRLIRAPKFSGDVSANYAIPTSIGRVELNGVASYTGRFDWSVDNRLVEPEHVVFNASVKLTLNNNLSLSVWGKNLGNEYVYAYALVGQEGDFGIPAPPRTYGFTVGYKF